MFLRFKIQDVSQESLIGSFSLKTGVGGSLPFPRGDTPRQDQGAIPLGGPLSPEGPTARPLCEPQFPLLQSADGCRKRLVTEPS